MFQKGKSSGGNFAKARARAQLLGGQPSGEEALDHTLDGVPLELASPRDELYETTESGLGEGAWHEGGGQLESASKSAKQSSFKRRSSSVWSKQEEK